MFNISKLETKFQEIFFLLGWTLLLVSFVLGIMFLSQGQAPTHHSFGVFGLSAISFLFSEIGIIYFYLLVLIFRNTQIIIHYCQRLSDIKRIFSLLMKENLFHVCMIFVLAIFLGIFHHHNEMGVNKAYLLGGSLGFELSSPLFHYLGFAGSLITIVVATISVAIGLDKFQITSPLYLAGDIAKWVSLKLKSFFQSSSESEDYLELLPAKVNSAEGVTETQIAEYQAYKQAANSGMTVELSQDLMNRMTDSKKLMELKRAIMNKECELLEFPKTKETAKRKTANRKPELIKANKKIEKKSKLVDAPEVLLEEEVVEDKQLFKIVDSKKKYKLPTINLLNKVKKFKSALGAKELEEIKNNLEERLLSFGVEAKVVKLHQGERLTLFELEPKSGVKSSKIQALTNDLALLLGAPSIRILTPIPGKMTIGIEVPNKEVHMVGFADTLSVLKKETKMNLPIALGKDVYGDVIVQDLSAMPHLLVSGTTGSGKSVFMNTLIQSLIYKNSPKDLKIVMVDPKMIELTPYNGIPHLLGPVISDVEKAKEALVWAMEEMDKRYEIFSAIGARNIESFNSKIAKSSIRTLKSKAPEGLKNDIKHMPYIVVLVDELADLMITQGKEVEIPITRIAQKARACGIHLVLSTQRPSSDIVTGLIKTNFPSRIAFKVSSSIDSRTILDKMGAEKLLGNGDMLYLPNGKQLVRLQGSFVSEEEVARVVKYIS